MGGIPVHSFPGQNRPALFGLRRNHGLPAQGGRRGNFPYAGFAGLVDPSRDAAGSRIVSGNPQARRLGMCHCHRPVHPVASHRDCSGCFLGIWSYSHFGKHGGRHWSHCAASHGGHCCGAVHLERPGQKQTLGVSGTRPLCSGLWCTGTGEGTADRLCTRKAGADDHWGDPADSVPCGDFRGHLHGQGSVYGAVCVRDADSGGSGSLPAHSGGYPVGGGGPAASGRGLYTG